MQPSQVGMNGLPPQSPVRLAAPGQTQAFEPGGLGARFVARFVDGIVVSVITLPVGFAFGLVLGMMGLQNPGHQPTAAQSGMALMLQLVNFCFSMTVTFLYYGWFYRNKGATPDKLLMGLRVVDSATGT